MDLTYAFDTLLRFAHIGGAIVVLGGLFRAHISGIHVVDRYRGWLAAGALAIVLSGAWQFMQRMDSAPHGWHILIGLKILLGLHVVSTALLIGRPGLADERRERMAFIAVISGWIVVLLGAAAHTLR